jgi:hypothetical protein
LAAVWISRGNARFVWIEVSLYKRRRRRKLSHLPVVEVIRRRVNAIDLSKGDLVVVERLSDTAGLVE